MLHSHWALKLALIQAERTTLLIFLLLVGVEIYVTSGVGPWRSVKVQSLKAMRGDARETLPGKVVTFGSRKAIWTSM